MISCNERNRGELAADFAFYLSNNTFGVASLDHKKLMHHQPGGSDKLFDFDRPLSSFSAKIDLAYRIGLINSEFEHALQMIRKVRNEFAHSLEFEPPSQTIFSESPKLPSLNKINGGRYWN